MSGIESIDQSREPIKVWNSWPHCFVKAVSGIETQAKTEFSCPQAIAKIITRICYKLHERMNQFDATIHMPSHVCNTV